ncbi:MAG: STAS domain-containing protein [Bacteroidota bacterium]
MEIVSKKWNVFDVLEIQGRIDGLTAAALKRTIDQAAVDGRRNLILDFTFVSYMSSAGLRVILQSHKALNQIGGKLTLVSVPPAIMDVFNISGMGNFLQIIDELKSLLTVNRSDGDTSESIEMNLDGISFEWRKSSVHQGKFFSFGSDDKLLNASFEPSDQVVFKPAEIAFGLGLAALGDDYSDYKSLFGEAVVIGHHFFFYPAVNRPIVDYSYFSQESQHSLNFLYGFGINGEFARILRFDVSQNPLSIEALLHAAGKIAETGAFGVVILGTSGGIHSMHLKKSPIIENQLSAGNIFDAQNFPHWMNFSLESEEINKTIVAFGIVMKTPGLENPKLKGFLPENGGMHLHAAVFENGLWSNNIAEFEDELLRIVKEFEPQKVLHLLPDSKLKNGYIAIINLEAD